MFLGAQGVEVGCRTLPVSSSDGQDDGGRGWSGRNRGRMTVGAVVREESGHCEKMQQGGKCMALQTK